MDYTDDSLMTPPRLVIFDCDGVLVDSEPVTDKVLVANLSRYGLTLAEAEVHQLFAGGTMKGAGEEAVRRGATLPDDWLDEIYAEQSAALSKGVPLLDGIFPLLDALEAQGIATAVASNGPMSKMEITLRPSGLWDKFAGRIYSGHDFVPKPSPEMILHACATANVPTDRAVMIDDTATGCRAALNAGVRCFGLRPAGDTADLEAVAAIPVRSLHAFGQNIGVT